MDNLSETELLKSYPMKSTFKIIAVISAFLFLLLLCSCGEDLNHNLTTVKKKQEKIHKIQLHENVLSPLYEIEFKCINPDNYSQDSFEFINYRIVDIKDATNLELIQNKNGFEIIQDGRKVHATKYPSMAKSRASSIVNNKSKCNSVYNELFRIDYSLEHPIDSQHKHVKIFAYSTDPFTKNESFNWQYFLENKENLFNMYKARLSCNVKWKLDF